MPKILSKWVCQECGYTSISYLGKCPECNSFGTLIEEIIEKRKAFEGSQNSFCLTKDIKAEETNRISSFDQDLNVLLGGGFVQGSLILLAGEPGIGKSTILLQVADHLSMNFKVAYVTAEESVHQVKIRIERLNLKSNNLLLLSENNLESILRLVEKENPAFLIIDSIQAVYHPDLDSTCGNVSQVKECSNKLLRLSKEKNITTILVGHVNKEGLVAGPKVLEHVVDTVLYFEGEKFHNFRILRATKNRFGCTDEIVLFEMKDKGLKTISNPSLIFLSENNEPAPGNACGVILEGTKNIITEVQALVGSTSYAAPRRVANGLDYNRVLQIAAILERRIGLNFSKNDLYVNLVGGLSSSEPSLDLAIAMAIVSCKQDTVPKKRTVYIGEIGLVGEIRPVTQIENRIKECIKLGFERIVIPNNSDYTKRLSSEIEIVQVKKLLETIRNGLTSSLANL